MAIMIEFEKIISNAIKDWFQEIKKKDYDTAKRIAKRVVNYCKNIVLGGKDSQKKVALIVGIFFRGLEEFTILLKITNSSEWFKVPETVEKAWILLQNCKDRFKATVSNIQIDIDQDIINQYELTIYDVMALENTNKILFIFIDKDNNKRMYLEDFYYEFYISKNTSIIKNDYIVDYDKNTHIKYSFMDMDVLKKFNFAANSNYKSFMQGGKF